MVTVARIFGAVLDGTLGCEEAFDRLQALGIEAPFSNGFVQGRIGAAYSLESD